MIDITAKTFSAYQVFKPPMIEIESDLFRYSNTGTGYHGIISVEEIADVEGKIKGLCSDISDKLLELHKIINNDTK
jgi:hypothetical protein